MATHTFGEDHSALLGNCAKRFEREHQASGPTELRGSPFRGLFYAMIFNVFLALVGAGVWELWRVLR